MTGINRVNRHGRGREMPHLPVIPPVGLKQMTVIPERTLIFYVGLDVAA